MAKLCLRYPEDLFQIDSQTVQGLRQAYCSTFTIQYYIIKYEELIANFDEETQNLLRFLDIECDPMVKNYDSHVKSYKIISTPNYHQVSEPLYKRSLFRWKNYKEHLNPIIDLLRPYAKRFGCDLA